MLVYGGVGFSTRRPNCVGAALLTVEEAGAVLRVGRTKAYAMAQQWRTSGGTQGLPVIDLGSVLRSRGADSRT